MQNAHRLGAFGFLSVLILLLAGMMLSTVDASAQDEVPAPESSGTAPEAPVDPPAPPPPAETPPPPPPATQPPPPPPPPPPPTEPPPAATEPPPAAIEPPATEPTVPAETPAPTEEPVTTEPVPGTEEPGEATEPGIPEGPETATPEPTPDVVDPTPSAPPPAALGLPSPLPGPIGVVPGGGFNGLAMIWGYSGFGVSQEFGRTSFSVAHPTWYDYGRNYGLDGLSHPGLDISMPRGTWLYSPVSGTVVVSGNSSGFTFYGNGNSGVGELRIVTAAGHEVILGHMGRIAVYPGDYVAIGQFVGVSGGFNGDHLHLEARQAGRIVDPRSSFITGHIAETLAQPETANEELVPDEQPSDESANGADQGADPAEGEATEGEPDAAGESGTEAPVEDSPEGVPAVETSLQGPASRAGAWVRQVDTNVVESQLPAGEDEVAAGLEEAATRQPVPALVTRLLGPPDDGEDDPPV